jgi:hypothetical protein
MRYSLCIHGQELKRHWGKYPVWGKYPSYLVQLVKRANSARSD